MDPSAKAWCTENVETDRVQIYGLLKNTAKQTRHGDSYHLN